MNLDSFFSIAIVGVAASFIIEGINQFFGVDSFWAKIVTLLIAVTLGTAMWLLQGTAIWETILGILGVSSAVYAFFLKSKK